jgi:putative ABC transport system permease protein
MALHKRLLNVFRRNRVAREIEQEMAFHIAERVDDLMAQGMSPQEARREARRRFGNPGVQRERTRDIDIVVWLDSVLADARFALRSLVKRPGFAAAAVTTLALGIGANGAIFSVVSGVILGDLPYRDADRLVVVYGSDTEGRFGISERERERYAREGQVFRSVGAFESGWATLTGDAEAERVRTGFIDADLLATLGASPALGRGFTEDEDRPGADGVAILSHGLWQRRFAGDSAVIGRTIIASANPVTVVGVMPEDFRLPTAYRGIRSALYLPLAIGEPDPRNLHYLSLVARMADGTRLADARSYMRGLSRDLREEITTLPETFQAELVPLREDLFGSVSSTLLVLQGSVALVLLIACLNVANLLLARSEGKMHEIMMRTALGASRVRIGRQLLTESLLLGLGGGAAGLALAVGLVRAVRLLNPPGVPRIDEIAVDPGVIGFTAAIAVGASLLTGLAPIVRLGRGDEQVTLRQEGRGRTPGVNRHRLQRSLVVAEIAIGLMLAIGAGLLGRSYGRMAGVDLGFRADRVVTMQLTLPLARYGDAVSARAFYSQLAERARALPGVQAFGGTNQLPLASDPGDWGIRIEGREEERLPSGRRPWADWSVVTDGYLEAMGLELLRGRGFSRADNERSLPVVVINETAARNYWPDGDALGARFKMSADIDTVYRTIIGIVRDVRHDDIGSTDRPQMYLPHSQFPATANFPVGSLTLAARTQSDPLAITGAMRQLVRDLDVDVPVSNVRTMDTVISAAMSVGRFNALLFAAFGMLGLALVAVGVYGVLGYTVAERTRELGIRAALGARPRQLSTMVVGQGVRVALVGVVAGLGATWLATRLLEGLLFGVDAHDPVVFGAMALVLITVAAAASYFPARQATAVDPMLALRE